MMLGSESPNQLINHNHNHPNQYEANYDRYGSLGRRETMGRRKQRMMMMMDQNVDHRRIKSSSSMNMLHLQSGVGNKSFEFSSPSSPFYANVENQHHQNDTFQR